MFKKILIALVVVMGLLAVPAVLRFNAPLVLASNPTPEGALDSSSFMFNLSGDGETGGIVHTAIKGSTREGWIRQGINYFFERAVSVMVTVIGSLAVLVMSVGGFLMLSSAGDETRYEKGKNYAKYSLIGLGVTLMAYILVSLVQLLIKSLYG